MQAAHSTWVMLVIVPVTMSCQQPLRQPQSTPISCTLTIQQGQSKTPVMLTKDVVIRSESIKATDTHNRQIEYTVDGMCHGAIDPQRVQSLLHHKLGTIFGPSSGSWVASMKAPWNVVTHKFYGIWRHKMSWYDYVRQNRWSLITKVGIGSYFVLNYMLFKNARFLMAPDRWMYWRSDITLVQLVRVPPPDLAQELVHALHTRRDLEPGELPLEALRAELDAELGALRWYLQWADYVERIAALHHHIMNIFEPKKSFIYLVPQNVIKKALSEGIHYIGKTLFGLINVKKVFYIQDDLVLQGPQYLRRIMYLRHVVQEAISDAGLGQASSLSAVT